ncbi:MerR family DNA-binding transcriptional regulator [Arcanobacterium hippocoleae]
MAAQGRAAEQWHAERISWPQEVSHEPNLRIGEVITLLNKEFPFLQASKIRYYESQNLISIFRTESNQRLFRLLMLSGCGLF